MKGFKSFVTEARDTSHTNKASWLRAAQKLHKSMSAAHPKLGIELKHDGDHSSVVSKASGEAFAIWNADKQHGTIDHTNAKNPVYPKNLKEEALLDEAARPKVSKGIAGHYALELHKHVGKSFDELHAHVNAIAKKHKYSKVTVVHGHSGDRHPERHHTELMPATDNSKITMEHPDGQKEEIHVSHRHGKVGRIGHHSSVSAFHHIHRGNETLQYKGNTKIRTAHHSATGTTYSYPPASK